MWLIIVQFWQLDKIHVTLYLNCFIFVRVQVEFWERLRQHPLIDRGVLFRSAEGADASKSLRQKGQNS